MILKPEFEVGQKLFYKNYFGSKYEIIIDSIEIDPRNQTFIYWYYPVDNNKKAKLCFTYKAFEKNVFFNKDHYIKCREKEIENLMEDI